MACGVWRRSSGGLTQWRVHRRGTVPQHWWTARVEWEAACGGAPAAPIPSPGSSFVA